jgi:hypothetical protein
LFENSGSGEAMREWKEGALRRDMKVRRYGLEEGGGEG